MSETEVNKGTLTLFCKDTEEARDSLFRQLVATGACNEDDDPEDAFYDNDFMFLKDNIYKVQFDLQADTMDGSYIDVTENDDGTIDFLTIHYNGGASLVEVLAWGLENETN